ncbi:MAG TPA: maleylpyruvate isomerase N-terminal domain-containing protein [Rugosimonospora sp.]|nr:maleylpyruvate isomerase N-terminal domain-containing protein [Rugosimonospora sp.]
MARSKVGAAALAYEVPDEPPLRLSDHYARVAWLGADVDGEANTGIREGSEREASSGAAVLVAQVREVVAQLRQRLPAEPADRVVRLPWTGWSLSLDDLLVTRMMEIAVHADDLAVSVGVDPPPLPEAVLEPVLDLLCRLSVRRHGPTAVLRALSRAERAPATISAF